MKLTGPIFFAFAVLAAAILGVQTYASYGAQTAIGIALGSASITAMSLVLILAARPRMLEPFFGGLDQMYGVHKWLGIAALALMIGHNIFEPDFEKFVRETDLGDFASEAGEIALNGFIALILISWIKRIPFTRLELPWPIWRFTHRFTGLLFAVAAFHQITVDKPADIDSKLGIFLNAFCLAGLLAWIFTELVAPFLRPRAYTLDRVDRHGAVTEITLRPEGRAIRWQPGQFAFVSAPDAKMNEAHPFTIAGAPKADGSLRFGIKGLGGWTKSLPERLAVGQRLRVEGPYGRFLFRKTVAQQVWLAGGSELHHFLPGLKR